MRLIFSFIILFVSLSFICETVYAKNVVFTYDQCVQNALRNNDQIRAARKDIEISEGQLYESHPKGIPVIKYEHRLAPVPKDLDNARESFFGGEISVFNSFRVEMGSAITTFGKIRTAQELATVGVDASILKTVRQEDEIALKIYQTYQGILLARELLALAAQAEKALREKIGELENDRIKDQLQILKLKVAMYEVQRRVEEAHRKEILAISTLRLLTGLERDIPFDIASKALKPTQFKLKSKEYYISEAQTYLPEYKLLKAGVIAKEKQLKLEKLKPVPNLGVGGFFDIGRAPDVRGDEDESAYTNPFNFIKAGIGLQLKGEFDYVKNKAKIKQAKSDLLKTIYQKRAAERGLELKLENVYLEVEEARNLMLKADDEKKVARQMVFLTKSNLDIGLGEKKDYLDALQSYLVFQGRQYEAIFNYNLAVASLKVHIGELYSHQRKENQ